MVSKLFKAFFCLSLLVEANYASAAQVKLDVSNDDITSTYPGGNKSPVEPPYVWQEDHELTFDNSCYGCTLRLLDEDDNVVYTTVITSTTLQLPATLSGVYELQIVQGFWCFYGDIEL